MLAKVKDTPSIPLDRLSGSKTQLMTDLSKLVENRGSALLMAMPCPWCPEVASCFSPHQKMPSVYIRSRNGDNPSGSKPMPTIDPEDLIGRIFLLPPEENSERDRARVTTKIVAIIDQENGHRIENINFILDIGNRKIEELLSYNQLFGPLRNCPKQ